MVKMRVNNNNDAVCINCKNDKSKSLEMFDIKFGDKNSDFVITLCDKCNDELFQKTLRASCMVNGRVKSKRDMTIINMRAKAKSVRW